MEGAEQEVAGQRGLQGRVGRGAVAYFADHDDFGVLPHEEPQAVGEVQAGGQMHLRLRHAVDRDLDRVLDGDQAPCAVALPGDLPQTSVDGGGLAASRRPGNEDRAGGFGQQQSQRLQHVVRQPEVVQPLVTLRAAEQPHHRPLAVQRGERANAHLHVVLRQTDAAFLRPVGVVGEQSGQDLETGDNIGGQLRRKHRDGRQHAVHAVLQFQAVAGRLKMDVADSGLPGGSQHRVHAASGIFGIGRIEAGKVLAQAGGRRLPHSLLSRKMPSTVNISSGPPSVQAAMRKIGQDIGGARCARPTLQTRRLCFSMTR